MFYIELTIYFQPHLPWYAPLRYFNECGVATQWTGAHDVTINNLSYMQEKLVKGPGCGEVHLYAGAPNILGGGTASPITLQEATRAYHATAIYMDRQIEMILNALEASSAKDNTIIFFLGDHGK